MYIGDKIGILQNKAEQAMKEGRKNEAARHYLEASDQMKLFGMNAMSEDTKIRRAAKAKMFYQKSMALKGEGKSAPPAVNHDSASSLSPKTELPANEYRDQVQRLRFQASVSWDDIGGMESVRDEFDAYFGIIMAKKPANIQLDVSRSIMLYGPPGTGKTMIAAAISNQLDATFFNVKAADLLSKYFGESSRIVSALYEEARSISDTGLSVIFIDEFDALCRSRESATSGAEQRILSTVLSELDGLSEKGEDKGVITIGATNRPDTLDHAIRSRFQRQFYIPLPDRAARQDILERILRTKGVESNYRISELTNHTSNFSGRDLEGLIRAAVSKMVVRNNRDICAVVRKGKEAIKDYQLQASPLTEDDFQTALETITINKAEIERSKKFFNSYGNRI